MRRLLPLLPLALMLGTAPGASSDEPRGVRVGEAPLVEITPATREAVRRGLAYLARSQQDDGAWPCAVGYNPFGLGAGQPHNRFAPRFF